MSIIRFDAPVGLFSRADTEALGDNLREGACGRPGHRTPRRAPKIFRVVRPGISIGLTSGDGGAGNCSGRGKRNITGKGLFVIGCRAVVDRSARHAPYRARSGRCASGCSAFIGKPATRRRRDGQWHTARGYLDAERCGRIEQQLHAVRRWRPGSDSQQLDRHGADPTGLTGWCESKSHWQRRADHRQ
jgi:hypothetical protein